MGRKVVLAGACRTAIGTMGGALSKIPAPDLATIVVKESLKRAGVRPEQVDEVYMGCVIQAGLGQNPARQAAVNAGIPIEVPATTINVLCGSGLHCVNLAAKLIASGDADIIVAGGMENMSKAPYLLYDARFGYRMGAAKMDDALLRDALRPNLVQTIDGTPCLMHGGPFANIAHGCNSVIATKTAMRRGSMFSSLPCWMWLSIIAASRLLAAPMAWISPVKWRLISSMGSTWA